MMVEALALSVNHSNNFSCSSDYPVIARVSVSSRESCLSPYPSSSQRVCNKHLNVSCSISYVRGPTTARELTAAPPYMHVHVWSSAPYAALFLCLSACLPHRHAQPESKKGATPLSERQNAVAAAAYLYSFKVGQVGARGCEVARWCSLMHDDVRDVRGYTGVESGV